MRRPSLDVLRGALVVVLLVVEWTLPAPGYDWLRHSPWAGIRLADVVFPGFLFLVGASAAVGRPRPLSRTVRRALTLVLLGLLFNAWGDTNADLSHLRIPGVLQMIGIAGLLGAVIIDVARRRLAVIIGAAAALVVTHAALLSLVPLECGTGRLVPGCSTSWSVDRAVFGAAHVYHGGQFGHDPEGVLSVVFGATAMVLFGWVAGRVLDDARAQWRLVGGLLAGALVSWLAFAPIKRVWTPTFGLLIAAGAAAALFALARMLDEPAASRPQPVRWTLAALGRNALLLYVGQHVVLATLEATPRGGGTLAAALEDHLGSPLGVAAFGVVAWTAFAAALHAADWYVTL